MPVCNTVELVITLLVMTKCFVLAALWKCICWSDVWESNSTWQWLLFHSRAIFSHGQWSAVNKAHPYQCLLHYNRTISTGKSDYRGELKKNRVCGKSLKSVVEGNEVKII